MPKDGNLQSKIEYAFSIQPERFRAYAFSDTESVSANDLETAVEKYKETGFVVLDINNVTDLHSLPPHTILQTIGGIFDLGPLYTPKQYSAKEREQFYKKGVNKIVAGDTKLHSNFYSASNQKIHADGTLDPFNAVRTAMLYCVKPAIEGGENSVFNLVGALFDLHKENPKLAEALFQRDALTKFSPSNPSLDEVTDSAFAFDAEGRIISRYSDSEEYCRWSNDPLVQEALKFMRERLISSDEPKRNVEFKLLSGQILIMANNQVAHSRKAFVQSDNNEREMWRALFAKDLTALSLEAY